MKKIILTIALPGCIPLLSARSLSGTEQKLVAEVEKNYDAKNIRT